jgi:trehalose synthase
MYEVPITPRAAGPLSAMADGGNVDRYQDLVARLRDRLEGHRLWHINSTPAGGGVAEILGSCLGYLVTGGIDVRWLVIEGDPGFFDITKRIHNRLHGAIGDGGPLAALERDHYERVIVANIEEATARIAAGDVVVVHDPQPIGLVPDLVRIGAFVIWTCHVGVDEANDICRSAWDFLRVYLDGVHAVTFTRRAYVWEGLEDRRIELIPPCIDALSLKNVGLDLRVRDAVLAAAGPIPARAAVPPAFTRADGTSAQVTRRAKVVEDAPTPQRAPLVVQVSRWDALKDPVGVIQGFAEDTDVTDAHLMLAGPAPSSVADDPEALQVLDDVERARERLHPDVRSRVHLANLPTDDVEENAVIVNALQRRADVVVQKSLAEGFGLTVTEAMWKRRPIVASGVGGILDQIIDGEHGRLVDPRNLMAFGKAVEELLVDRDRAAAFGEAAHERVRTRYTAVHYLANYLDLIERLTA